METNNLVEQVEKIERRGYVDPLVQKIIDEMETKPPMASALPCQFVKHANFNPVLTKKNGYPTSSEEIHKIVHVDPFTVLHQPIRICDEMNERDHISKHKVAAECADLDDTLIWKEQWARFQQGLSQDTIGFRLEAFWPNEPAKVENYRYLNILTVEQLAACPRHSNMPGFDQDQAQCREYLQKIKAAAPAQQAMNEVNELRRELDMERERSDGLMAELRELTASVKGMIGSPKKARGRPKKEETTV